MDILGLSCYYHDAAACLLRDGEVIAAVEEERLSRRKHDASFPINAIEYCLYQGGITAHDLDYVVFHEKPYLKFERILYNHVAQFPHGLESFRSAMKSWFKEKLWIASDVRRRLKYRGKVLFGEHHLSHAASSFFVSPFDEAAVLTLDGVGEWTTAATGVVRGTTLTLDQEVRFPDSLGLLYSAITAYLGFEVNEGEYKVMGMAAYGRPRYADQVRRLIRWSPDGAFRLDLRYFAFQRALRSYTDALVDLFGPPRPPDSDAGFGDRYADIAASVQQVTEEIMVAAATALRRRTGLRNLCMAGGVALNVLANARVLQEAGFDDLYIQPAAGDAGACIGAAAYLYHHVLGRPRTFQMRHAYTGPCFGDDDIRAFLDEHGIAYELHDRVALVEAVADALAAGQVVGWFQGRMEFGPRALGSRSILASALHPEMKDILNAKIKHREPFRPFAPVCPLEDAPVYFETSHPSPFMLLVARVRPEHRATIPAVTHADGTARLQTVTDEENGIYYDLVKAFGQRTGVPVLVNTSFNVRGEPIVCTPREAYNCFAHTDIDLLVLGNALVRRDAKRAFDPYPGRRAIREEEFALTG